MNKKAVSSSSRPHLNSDSRSPEKHLRKIQAAKGSGQHLQTGLLPQPLGSRRSPIFLNTSQQAQGGFPQTSPGHASGHFPPPDSLSTAPTSLWPQVSLALFVVTDKNPTSPPETKYSKTKYSRSCLSLSHRVDLMDTTGPSHLPCSFLSASQAPSTLRPLCTLRPDSEGAEAQPLPLFRPCGWKHHPWAKGFSAQVCITHTHPLNGGVQSTPHRPLHT